MRWKWLFIPLIIAGVTIGFCVRKNDPANKEIAFRQITANPDYIAFCQKAIEDPATFATFKRHPIYTLFYDNTSPDEGEVLLSLVSKRSPDFLHRKVLKYVRTLDDVGGPVLHTFGRVGKLSPSLLRYLKIASDIQLHFSECEKFHVIEVGAGAGGLCKVLHDLFDIECYTIVDQKESLELAKKHLHAHGIHHVRFVAPEELKTQPCDLLISNYAFTESNESLQKELLKMIFPYAERGYLVCNFFPKHFGVGPLKKRKLFEKIRTLKPHYEVFPEEPKTGKDNCILIWRRD